jgi:hypothetical protein
MPDEELCVDEVPVSAAAVGVLNHSAPPTPNAIATPAT